MVLEVGRTTLGGGKVEGKDEGVQGEGIDADRGEEGQIGGREGITGINVCAVGGRLMEGES